MESPWRYWTVALAVFAFPTVLGKSFLSDVVVAAIVAVAVVGCSCSAFVLAVVALVGSSCHFWQFSMPSAPGFCLFDFHCSIAVCGALPLLLLLLLFLSVLIDAWPKVL